jgi:hypothetical protein
MKKLIFTTLFLMLCAVFALAQTSGTNQSNPSSQQPGTTTSSPSSSTGGQDTMAPSTSTSSTSQDQMGNKSQSSASTKTDTGKEKTITGCLESAGSSGQYVIRHKNKDITVVPSSAVSSEIASHVGHKVKVHGEWEQASAASSSSGSSTMASNTGSNMPQSDQPGASPSSTSGKSKSDKNASKEFRAEKIEMVSDSCGGKSSTKSDTSTNPSSNPKPY